MRFVDFQPGPADGLRLVEGPVPTPGETDVLIRVEAAGVNRPDILQRMGKYPPPAGASPILGLEVAGAIAHTPPNSRWKQDDRVCALTPGGGYAEYSVVPEPQVLPIPDGLSMEEAAGIPETFFTVWANVFQMGSLKAGERILIHGGASGIGTTAIQLARAFGATPFVTAGSEEKCAACLRLGAEAAIDYLKQDFVQEIRKLTPVGVDLVLDLVGAPYTPRNIECLAMFGRLLQIAAQQGAEATVNLAKVMQKRLIITGSTMRPRSIADKGRIARELEERVWPLLASKQVKVVVDRVFPLDEVSAAHRYLESGAHIGKVILKVTS
jgi:putative PIG3 family NAD(P)H quinone oxidoreductase